MAKKKERRVKEERGRRGKQDEGEVWERRRKKREKGKNENSLETTIAFTTLKKVVYVCAQRKHHINFEQDFFLCISTVI